MAEADALSKFDFSSFGGSGLFLKFEAGKPLTLRILTTDPVVKAEEFKDDSTGEVTVTTKFYFVVYNFTDSKAQILGATPTMARKIGELHVDPEFGANIKKIDVRISPTGEKLTRRYDMQVLPKARDLTMEQVKEAQGINLDEAVKDGGRMSLHDGTKTAPVEEANELDTIAEVPLDDEPINLDEIPF